MTYICDARSTLYPTLVTGTKKVKGFSPSTAAIKGPPSSSPSPDIIISLDNQIGSAYYFLSLTEIADPSTIYPQDKKSYFGIHAS
jgi:hypothetical protein